MRKELLGVVGVDSGGLVIMDPCYIEGEMNRPEVLTEVIFWGRDQEALATLLGRDGKYIVVEGYSHYSIPISGEATETVEKDLHKICEEHDWLVMTHIETNSFQDRAFGARDNDKNGGGLPFVLGHEGLAVSFQSGYGDGVYEVWATYDGNGVINKVEIILVDDEEEIDE